MSDWGDDQDGERSRLVGPFADTDELRRFIVVQSKAEEMLGSRVSWRQSLFRVPNRWFLVPIVLVIYAVVGAAVIGFRYAESPGKAAGVVALTTVVVAGITLAIGAVQYMTLRQKERAIGRELHLWRERAQVLADAKESAERDFRVARGQYRNQKVSQDEKQERHNRPADDL